METNGSQCYLNIKYKLNWSANLIEDNIQKDSFIERMLKILIDPQKIRELRDVSSLVRELGEFNIFNNTRISYTCKLWESIIWSTNDDFSENVNVSSINELYLCWVTANKKGASSCNDPLTNFLLSYKYTVEILPKKNYLENVLQDFLIFRRNHVQKLKTCFKHKNNRKKGVAYPNHIFNKKLLPQEYDKEERKVNEFKTINLEHLKSHIVNFSDLQKKLTVDKSKHKTFNDIFSNEGYIFANLKFLRKLKRMMYYAFGSYGNSWPTLRLKRQAKFDQNQVTDPNRRAVLELLNIEDENLLSFSLKNTSTPAHLIFFDKKYKRLVLSFKGTTTSTEAFTDLDGVYASFYEGFAHRGIKNQAIKFVENKT